MKKNSVDELWDAVEAYRQKRISLPLFRARLKELGKDEDEIDFYTDDDNDGGDDE